MLEESPAAAVEPIVRGLTSAAKSLRLYPPTSPIPREAVASAVAALDSFIASEGGLTLRVARDGLAYAGATVAPGSPGAAELADALRSHGVAEIGFEAGVTGDELLILLQAVLDKPEELADTGGLAGALSRGSVASIVLVEVELHVVDNIGPADDEDAESFLRELAQDPDRLAAWLSQASHGDPAVLEAGLADIAAAVGPEGMEQLSASLARAFGAQDSEGRDTVLGIAMQRGSSRDLLASVFGRVPPGEVATSLCEGAYGSNMLAMSSALTRLPLAEKMGEVLAQVQDILPTLGKGAKEMGFLDHMLEIRGSDTPEVPLVEAQPTYRQVAELTHLDEAQITDTREQVVSDAKSADDNAVLTMLTLIDKEMDHSLYGRTLEGLCGMVPHLIEARRLDLASRVISELEHREAATTPQFRDAPALIGTALSSAVTEKAARELLKAVAEDSAAASHARVLMRRASEAAMNGFVMEALVTRPNGVELAEGVVGRRVVDMLVAYAPKATAAQLGQLASRLGREGEARPVQAMENLLRRSDPLERREIATGLGASGGPLALRYLQTLLADGTPEVAAAAARAIGRSDAPGAAAALATRFGEIDADVKDFETARELLGALARVPDPAADEALQRISGRKALIKRGHFAELNALAAQAAAQRAKGGGAR